jgi:hypothetical protein
VRHLIRIGQHVAEDLQYLAGRHPDEGDLGPFHAELGMARRPQVRLKRRQLVHTSDQIQRHGACAEWF